MELKPVGRETELMFITSHGFILLFVVACDGQKTANDFSFLSFHFLLPFQFIFV